MASKHAQSGEIVHIQPLGSPPSDEKTSTLVKTKNLEVIRIVMQAGKEISEHQAPGEIVVQCLEGKLEFKSHGKVKTLDPGQLLYLTANEPHSVKCLENGAFLLTTLKNG